MYDTITKEPSGNIVFEKNEEFPVSKEVIITNTGDKPFNIKSVKAYRPYLETTYEVMEEGKKFKVIISQTKPSGKNRRETTTVRVITDRDRSPNINIRIITPPSEESNAVIPPDAPARHQKKPAQKNKGASKE